MVGPLLLNLFFSLLVLVYALHFLSNRAIFCYHCVPCHMLLQVLHFGTGCAHQAFKM